MFSLEGKVALVTGSSSGIGRAAAIALSQQGAVVALAARRIDRLEELKKDIESKGEKAMVLPMDVLKTDDIVNGIQSVISTYGTLDILINNAGIGATTPTLEMSEETWDRTLDTNLRAYFLLSREAAKHMVKQKWGRIVNIASILSGGVGSGLAGTANYSASKGGVVAMTEAMADEFATLGITVNAIGPGFIETEMTQQVKAMPDFYNAIIGRIPMKRFGTPEEIAAAIVYLSSVEASYTTGATFYIDGGWTAS